MTRAQSTRMRGQGGFTLIELLIATAMGLVVMSALSSVVMTTYQADKTATERVEVAGEIRNFQQVAYDDFASSSLPSTPGGCGTSSQPCTQDAIQLNGCTFLTSGQTQPRQVAYAYSSATRTIGRQLGSSAMSPQASNVTAFTWFVDGAAPNQTVVVNLTVTMGAITQSQTLRFYPRVVSQLPAFVSAAC